MSKSEQARYQVRFDLGLSGAHAIGTDADIIVWVDALGEPFETPVSALPSKPAIVVADLRTAIAAADWVLAEQVRLGRRFATAVVAAAGDRAGADRFAVENFIAAGAVIDRLSTLGLDATSPEAAVAEAAYRTLGRAVGHLITASTTAVSSDESVDSARLKIDPAATTDSVQVLRSLSE